MVRSAPLKTAMCRLFAYIGTEPRPLRSHFLETHKSLLKQANKNAHGWGIASFDSSGKRTLDRECTSAQRSKHFFEVARALNAPLVLAHIRFATVGEKDISNVHPFTTKEWTFAHNGTVQKIALFRDKILAMLPPHLRNIVQGTTDSEMVFVLFLYELEQLQNVHDENISKKNLVISALRNAVTHINEMALEHGAEGDSRINILLTDGKTLWGTRFGKHLFRKRGKNADRVIATERTGEGSGWKSFPENIVFHITPGADEIDIRPLLPRRPDFAIPHPKQRDVSS